MCSLPREIRFTFKGLWEVCADDHGRFLADVRVIKGQVWPLDDDLSLKKIERFLLTLAERGRILLYSQHGVRYGFLVNWLKHQRVSHPSPSRFPSPDSGTIPESVEKGSGNRPEEFASDSVRSGAEGSREERKGSGAEAREELENESAPPAPLFVSTELPKGAVDFLAMFYEPALSERQRERYRDVGAQLRDTIDPRHPGPKIRGGTRVKARDVDHLEACCRAVMRDPPNDRDKAIVIVLKRLTDPVPGPTPAERHKAETAAAIATEDAYHNAARRAATEWAREHPDDYAPILARVDAQFAGLSDNPITRIARDSQLTQACSRAAGFPDFATWILELRTPQGSAA